MAPDLLPDKEAETYSSPQEELRGCFELLTASLRAELIGATRVLGLQRSSESTCIPQTGSRSSPVSPAFATAERGL
jgi:hypothetical protein